MSRQPLFLLIAASILLALPLEAQGRPRRGGGQGRVGAEAAASQGGPKSYDEVIKKDFQSDAGLFLVHRGDDKVFYEIPVTALGRDLLWVTQIAKTQAGFGYNGSVARKRVVRWELRDEKVLLRDIKYSVRGDEEDTIRHAVETASVAPIIQVFDVKAWGKDKAPVIDVTGLFKDDLPEFSAKSRLNASGVDKERSFIEEIKSFPTNIEAKILMTYRLSSGEGRGGGSPSPRRPDRGARRDPSQSAVTTLLHHSMVALPETPMQPREYDNRVGFFNVSFQDFNTDDQALETIRYITRWRLEKKEPEAAVSEPIQPIVFYVAREVPEKWRPWVHKGIEMWQPAFEKAGFRNAILAKDAPDEREDPDWDAEDARYSTIRWLPSEVENAMGPHVNDPRTGEILEADILVFHNVIKLVRDWYFVQASPNDPRAQSLPLPDDIIGECLAYVIAHEVGHSLGFPHNMKASSTYTVAQLRDPEFTAKYGTEASIMDYGRFNYVAQPGDGARLIPVIGPYDEFAVEWGYRQFDRRKQEREGLAALTARQVENPMLRFGDPNASEDPSQQTEDLGSDSIEATAMGLKNIDRVANYLVSACCREGEDYALLRNMYDRLLGQRNRELVHVANVIGGVVRANLWYGDAEGQYAVVDGDRQREAMAFLNEHAFRTPQALVRPEILARLESDGAADRILSSQRRVLMTLINESRVKRMTEAAEHAGANAYLPVEMLNDLNAGIWSELRDAGAAIHLYRRNLQRAHADILIGLMETDSPTSDLPAIARGSLEVLSAHIAMAVRQYSETDMNSEFTTTRLHLRDLHARIRQALEPRGEQVTTPIRPAVNRAPRWY